MAISKKRKIPEPIQDLSNLKIRNYRRVWQPFMKKHNCQTICEIGVFEGENFELMIKHKPKLAVAVDAWVDDGVISRNDSGKTQRALDKAYKRFVKRMAGKSFVKVYRAYSFDAVKYFPDEYFDLIYIDADHSFEAVTQDISDWYPKVKKGWFLTGDDYRNGTTHGLGVKLGVKKAVGQFAEVNNLTVYELPHRWWAIIKP